MQARVHFEYCPWDSHYLAETVCGGGDPPTRRTEEKGEKKKGKKEESCVGAYLS